MFAADWIGVHRAKSFLTGVATLGDNVWVRRLVFVTTVASTLGDFAGDIVRVRRLIGAITVFVAEHSVGEQCFGAEAMSGACCGVCDRTICGCGSDCLNDTTSSDESACEK